MEHVLPAKCPKCDHVFRSNILRVDPGIDIPRIILQGNSSTCPKCGHAAPAIEGEFTMKDSRIEPIKVDAKNRELLIQFQTIFEDAQKSEKTLEELADALEPISKEAAAIVRLAKGVPAKRYIAAVLLVLGAKLAAPGADIEAKANADIKVDVRATVDANVDVKFSLDVNELFDQIMREARKDSRPTPMGSKEE